MRDHENVWIIPAKDKVAVFFSVHFDQLIDQAICRLIKNEMEETMRQVKNAPTIKNYPGWNLKGKIPQKISSTFENSKAVAEFKTNQPSNGLLQFGNSFFSTIITPTALHPVHFQHKRRQGTLLSGFRQYLHYHSSKSYLHGRVRRKINQMHKELQNARFEEATIKHYRAMKGGPEEKKLKE